MKTIQLSLGNRRRKMVREFMQDELPYMHGIRFTAEWLAARQYGNTGLINERLVVVGDTVAPAGV